MRKIKYEWKDDIWAIHLELKNKTDKKETATVFYSGDECEEDLVVLANEAMRFNICKYSNKNDYLEINLPEDFEMQIYENLDRAFYTDIPM